MNEIVTKKREELLLLVHQHMAHNPAVQAVVVTGSVATGFARPDSDIDAVVFLDPVDHYIVPAESKWEIGTDRFHSIFSPDLEGKQIAQFEFKRLDLAEWKKDSPIWTEPMRALLKEGWIAYDPSGFVTKLIEERTAYTEQVRQKKLDEAILHIDQNLDQEKATKRWRSLPPIVAHNRLSSAYKYLVQAIFAYNGRWRPWHNREMAVMLNLPWLPDNFSERIFQGSYASSMDEVGYLSRLSALIGLFDDLQKRLIADGLYSKDILNEAFIRANDTPGMAWNMTEWNREFMERRIKE